MITAPIANVAIVAATTVTGSGGRRLLIHRGRNRHGLGLIELLISLAITSALLTAVAVATAVSAKVVTDNDQFTRAAQAARVAVNMMLADCRRGEPDPDGITETSLRVLPYGKPTPRTYRYDADTQQILMSDLGEFDLPGPEYVVVRNVTSASFDGFSSGPSDAVRRVTINLTVSIGGNAVHLSGSAAPRQNATF